MAKGKRIFLNWADDIEETVKQILELQKLGHEVVYWIGLEGDRSAIWEVIFHEHFDAWAGRPAQGIDPESFPPLCREFIEECSDIESIVLTMMNKRFEEANVDERRHIYYELMRYWLGILKTYKPDIVAFHSVPHSVYNYIIYVLAQKLGIRTLMFEDPWIGNRFLVYNDLKEGSRPLQEELKKQAGKNFTLDDLDPAFKEYYLKQSGRQDMTPGYMKDQKKDHTVGSLSRTRLKAVKNGIKDGTLLKTVYQYLKRELGPNLRKEYAAVAKEPDLKKKFVYVPLGYQPERTTSPQGGVFADQILMIEMLSNALPKDWVIYVKEHPSQWWLRAGVRYISARYRGYYERIAKIRNVRLVPISTSTFDMINNCQAVALVTGTAAWEAILRGKAALVFGYAWYRDCSEIFRVDSPDSCRAAFQKIENGWKVNQQNIINYMKCYENAAPVGSPEHVMSKNPEIDTSKLKETMFQVFLKELKSLQ